jgi:hypothetical protein
MVEGWYPYTATNQATAADIWLYTCNDSTTTEANTNTNWIYENNTTSATDTTTLTTAWRVYYDSNGWQKPSGLYVPKTPQERMREIIKSRISPAVHVRNNPLSHTECERETRARETLKRVVGEAQFRRFLSKGFVTAKGKSGKVYQIFPGHGITKVYYGGKMIERLCVVLPGSFPPTDSVIVRYLLAINNEQMLWSKGIKHGVISIYRRRREETKNESLTDLFQKLKVA